MHRRRFLQVSIRSLLILTTLVAIGCAFWTRFAARVARQKLAKARVLALGGTTQTQQSTMVWPWLQKLIGEKYFEEMVVVTLNETVATDADLELIGKADGMQTLLVSGIAPQPATRFGMYGPRLPQNPNRLPSQITDDGIRRLGLQPDLSSVSFAHALLTDQALETISSWQQLESLDLQGTKVTSQGIESLKKLGQLKVLNLDGTRVDDDAVQILKKIGSLKKLSVSNTKISGTGLLQLREQLPGCQLVGDYEEISSGVDPDPESMRWKEITRYLWRSGREGKLKLLILTDSGVTDGHLDDLHRLEKTDLIDLRRTQVSEAGVEKLQRMLPDGKLLH